MEKKDFKMYESPVMETIDLELEGSVLTESEGGTLNPVIEEED